MRMYPENPNQPENHDNTVWVTDFNTPEAIYFCDTINRMYQENPLKPIIIKINSDGGNVDDLFMMLDHMDAISSMADLTQFSFITYASGKAYSAGAALLSHGHFRLASPNSRIMLHQVIGGTYGPYLDAEVQHREMTTVNNQIMDLVARNCKFPNGTEGLRKILQRDKFFSPKEALAFGLIDQIGHPKLAEMRVYELLISNVPPQSYLKTDEGEDKTPKKRKGKK